MNIISLLVYCVIVTFTPGPTNIVILSGVNHCGAKRAMEFVYGATVAIGLLLAASVLLSRLLMTVVPKVLPAMQAIGCVYMLYLAAQILGLGSSQANIGQAITFRSGFLMQLVNPKVVLFTLTVIPSFVMPHDTSALVLAAAVAGVTFVAFAAMLAWVLGGAVFKELLQRYQKAVNFIMALFLVYSALMISGLIDLFGG